MLTFLLPLLFACGSGDTPSSNPWPHQKGTQVQDTLDATVDAVPKQLGCEGSYAVRGSHAIMVDDCEDHGAHAYDNPLCDAAYGQILQAANGTNCPEPPPVSCPQRVQELWRGWRCGPSPGMTGTFASCTVHARVSCNQ